MRRQKSLVCAFFFAYFAFRKRELDGMSETQAIAHVSAILEELGVEGRPTLEKCEMVRETRETEAEIRELQGNAVLDGRLRKDSKEFEGESSEPESMSAFDPLNLSRIVDSESDDE